MNVQKIGLFPSPKDAEHPPESFGAGGLFQKSPRSFGLSPSPDNIRGGFYSSSAVSFRLPASAFRIVEFVVYCICGVFHKRFPARILQSKANTI